MQAKIEIGAKVRYIGHEPLDVPHGTGIGFITRICFEEIQIEWERPAIGRPLRILYMINAFTNPKILEIIGPVGKSDWENDFEFADMRRD